MDLFQIFVLGIVQGLTEMLPISSSGHLVLFPKLLGWTDPGLNVDAFLHLGTLAAILIYFWKDLWNLVLKKDQRMILLYIVLATLPVVLIGFTCKHYIETSQLLRSTKFISFTLIFVAILMWFFDRKLESQSNLGLEAQSEDEIQTMSLIKTLFIGFAQCFALLPGVSRSGICAVAGIAQGMSREAAIRFAFLLGSPAIAGAGLLATKDMLENYINSPEIYSFSHDLPALLAGFISSFVSGLWAIDFLIKFLNKNTFTVFVVYIILLGLVVLFV